MEENQKSALISRNKKCSVDGLQLTMHSSSLWLIRGKPSKKPKHIPQLTELEPRKANIRAM